MHPRLQEVLSYADRCRDELMTTVATVDPALAQRAPGEDGWSIAEVLEHLALVESTSVRALFRGLRNARAAGLGDETESASLAPLIASIEGRMYEGKRTAPEFTRPTTANAELPALVARLAESRAGLQTWSREADGAALEQATFPHPALGELSLYGWVVMIGAHERRHARQIADIAAALASR